jgi:hypothetical protein
VAGCGGRGAVAVVFQAWAGLDEDVADGAGADLEQFAEDLACADFPLVEDGGEDSLGVGDLLSEDAASGPGEPFTAAPLVAEAFEAGGLERGKPLAPRSSGSTNANCPVSKKTAFRAAAALILATAAPVGSMSSASAANAPVSHPRIEVHFDIAAGQQPENLVINSDGSVDLVFARSHQIAMITHDGRTHVLATLPAPADGGVNKSLRNRGPDLDVPANSLVSRDRRILGYICTLHIKEKFR